ncbi:hypothetical protein GPJ56_002568 [Histomonas meleagridis]|uniref:uncharacterized protein n=1 Tax=Histomonas meleagridis TaxID=135588 RepID=UPI003559C8A0|nr:hypothetical protein GPJ56_002568 [Histomonas meleagridis]KAH0801360.1 hypothetical protein GO595_005955 [Histomonas meleagridis]
MPPNNAQFNNPTNGSQAIYARQPYALGDTEQANYGQQDIEQVDYGQTNAQVSDQVNYAPSTEQVDYGQTNAQNGEQINSDQVG